MLFEQLIPNLPSSTIETLIIVVGILGIILLPYSVFVEAEHRSDLIRALGALCLVVYSVFIGSIIMAIAMGALAIASLIEFLEIYLGWHKHTKKDVDAYKKDFSS